MILEVTFKDAVTIAFPNFEEEKYDMLIEQLNDEQIVFFSFEGADGKKFTVNKDNILMLILKSDDD